MIAKNKVVSLHYRLKKEDKNGALIEETYQSEPLTFIYGIGHMLPKFETELSGLHEMDQFAFQIKATDAYGEFDEQAIIDLDINIFLRDGQLDTASIYEGALVPMRNSDGHRIDGKVVQITDAHVKMDFNHPLAGQDLFFEGEITALRDATAEEISHGHVHSHGHHDHDDDHGCGCGSGSCSTDGEHDHGHGGGCGCHA
ncbi:MAG: FKBP-type peptidyl-prolyl cis-trans isomerase [Bacteroidales bacterium]|nr:FKBP-type peptidyl-prolyl cis-trans isomerase [Bacteroidales bacterium]